MLFGRYKKDFIAAATPAPVTRQDGWYSPATGLGGGKASQGMYLGGIRLSDWELSNLYYGDDLAAKVVDAPVDEAFRVGYALGGVDQVEEQKLKDAAEALDLDTKFTDAVKWGRLYGGSLLTMGILDNADIVTPLALVTKQKPLAFLNDLDRRSLDIFAYYKGIAEANYGEPAVYTIRSTEGQSTLLHASRAIRFDGVKVDKQKQRELNGWSYSVLQRVYDRLREFGLSFAAVNTLVQEASQGVWAIEGLHEMLTSGETGALMARMQMAEAAKGVNRSIIVDAEKEGFTRVTASLQGIPEVLDRLMMRISAATGIPVALLMGRSAAGMNATGEGDEKAWHATVKSYQEKELGPKLLQIYRRLAQGLGIKYDSLSIDWLPLCEATTAERGALYLQTAQADNIYITAGVLEPEQVQLARFGGGFDAAASPVVDVKALEATLAAVKTVDETGHVELTPSDLANVITVGEARASVGLDPLPDRAANGMSVNAYAELQASKQAALGTNAGQKESDQSNDSGQSTVSPPGKAP